MVYKKHFLGALLSALLLAQHWLHAVQIGDTLSDQHHHPPREITISHDKNFSGMNFTGKTLPQDLTYANLTWANLAGHHFRHTNFTGTQLNGVILTGTTCDYQQCFQDNMKASKLTYGQWYLERLQEELESIAQIYPQLAYNEDKAGLLQIACGLAYLPYYRNTELYIKEEYWSCKLLLLKKRLGNLGKALVCSLANDLLYEADNCCWQTAYPYHFESPNGIKIANCWCRLSTKRLLPNDISTLIQHYLRKPPQNLYANFNAYLHLFRQGLVNYNVQSKRKWSYNHYKHTIESNIQGLKKAYPKLTSEKLRKEAMAIAHQLSQLYKIEHWLLL